VIGVADVGVDEGRKKAFEIGVVHGSQTVDDYGIVRRRESSVAA